MDVQNIFVNLVAYVGPLAAIAIAFFWGFRALKNSFFSSSGEEKADDRYMAEMLVADLRLLCQEVTPEVVVKRNLDGDYRKPMYRACRAGYPDLVLDLSKEGQPVLYPISDKNMEDSFPTAPYASSVLEGMNKLWRSYTFNQLASYKAPGKMMSHIGEDLVEFVFAEEGKIFTVRLDLKGITISLDGNRGFKFSTPEEVLNLLDETFKTEEA